MKTGHHRIRRYGASLLPQIYIRALGLRMEPRPGRRIGAGSTMQQLGIASSPSSIGDDGEQRVASNWLFSHREATMVHGSYAPGFKVALHHKDLAICTHMADEANIPLSITEVTLTAL